MKFDVRIREAESAGNFQLVWFYRQMQREHHQPDVVANARYLKMIRACPRCEWDRRFKLGVRPCPHHRLERNQDGVLCYGWRGKP